MAMLIREAEEQDLEGIVECHCSDVEKWQGYRDGKVVELSYEELSPYERCHLNCGQWLDRDVCKLHLQVLEEMSETAFVAELGDRVVGEAEVCLADEPLSYGKYAFLTMLMVHRNFRRRGIGLALLRHTIQWARERGCRAYDTIPEDGVSEGLYEKAGLKPMQSLYRLRGDVGSLRCERVKASINELSISDDPSEDLLMVAGHINPSVHVWKDAFNRKLFLGFKGYDGRIRQPVAVRLSAEKSKGVVLLAPVIYNPVKSYLHLFTDIKMAQNMRAISHLIYKGIELAQQKGIETLEMIVGEEMLPTLNNIGFRQTGHRDLYMRLVLGNPSQEVVKASSSNVGYVERTPIQFYLVGMPM